MDINTPKYKKAFREYLRRGTPLDILLKEEHPTTHYIWRTREDDKVRGSHAANNGKIFSWDSPPETGHPGEEYGCRCWAEPVEGEQTANQYLISAVNDNSDKWSNTHFIFHAVFGKKPVTLQETGYLADVINYYANHAISKDDGLPGIYRRVNQQIIGEAKKHFGSFTYSFNSTYDFQDIRYVLRNSKVSGIFSGEVREENKFQIISGTITYDYTDKFEDPASVVEFLQRYRGYSRQEAQNFVDKFPDLFVYPIQDQWQTKFNATVKNE